MRWRENLRHGSRGAEVIGGLAKHGFSAGDRMAIDRGNALRLFPRLKG